jgi:hypothetical protein
MSKFNFRVEQPTLLGATFSVMTSADGEPIVCKVDERGHWSFYSPKGFASNSFEQGAGCVREAVCPRQYWGTYSSDRFFEDALSEAKDIPPT